MSVLVPTSNSSAYKPGVLRGAYPERACVSDGWIDRVFARIQRRANRFRRFNQKTLWRVVEAIHACEYAKLHDEELAALVPEIKSALHSEGFSGGAAIKAFALIQEIAARELGMRHFDVQLVGGWVMLQGLIAEMHTGEGKTLTATLPAGVAAMAGIPVHIVTVNDYLVQRDAELMGPIYRALGLSCGTIVDGMDFAARRAAYACNITYCSNKQLTFDYLKDRIVLGRNAGRLSLQLDRLNVQKASRMERALLRGLCFAIVDEADSVLIDESRTPLILSKERQSLDQLLVYQQALHIAEQLEANVDFNVNIKQRTIELTLPGKAKIEQLTESLTGIWKAARRRTELITQALTARHLFINNIHYLIKDGKIQIIDEYTGRVMPDRSWERGLHQMIETKEGCTISEQKETIARISYQNFFRRYLHLAGMTGTAAEVKAELQSVYGISVIKVPPNRPMIRKALPTRYYAQSALKWKAIVQRIKEINLAGRPVLIGTRSVEASEHLGYLLTLEGLPHRILNARQDADEAAIVKDAGRQGCITVATNMAGRGTDIKISRPINDIGGLHVILSECHEAGRIDRQLFGRCGRQGDQGSYERFLSFEDELIVKYGAKYLNRMALRWKEKNPLVFSRLARWLFRRAQQRAESHHAAIRYSLLKQDTNLQQLLAFSGKSE